MKRRFFAMFLASGLVMGLCGCGNAGASSTPEPVEGVVSEARGEASAQEPAGKEAYEDDVESYSADDLEEMWSSGLLTREEIEEKVAIGEISSTVYEEFLNHMSNDQEFNIAQADEASRDEDAASDTDILSLLTTHTVEYEDRDGYKIRETCQLSPIFTEDDSEAMYSLWETLGNNVESFPSEEMLYGASHSMEYARDADNCDKLEYIIGTYTIENLTDGFPITPDKPYAFMGSLHAEQVSAFDEEHDANAANSFNARSVSVAVSPDGVSYYAEQGASVLAKAKMSSDIWDSTCFIIVLPNGATPNRPDGYRYDKILIEFGNKSYGDLGYDTFGLEYFE